MSKLRYKIKKNESNQNNQKPLLDVPMDKTGELANMYVDTLNEIKEQKENLDIRGAALIVELKAHDRDSVSVRGIKLTIKSIEAKIKIAATRQKEN